MNPLTRWLRKAGLTLVVLPLLTVPATAAGIGFKSLVGIPIIVQGASKDENTNTLRRGQPVVIMPGKMGWDLNLKPGFRIITIYDGRQPNRILFQGPIPFQGLDRLFIVRPVPRNPFQVLVVPVTP